MEPSIMTRSLERRLQLEKIKSGIRLLTLVTLFSFFCAGIFVQDGSIYAKGEAVLGASTSIFQDETIPPRDFSPKSITIRGKGFEKKVLVYSMYAKDILDEADIHLDSDDEILPSSKEYIPHKGVIVLVKVDSKIFKHVEPIKYQKKIIEDDKMDKGKSVVDVKGVNGILEKTVRVIYKDDKAYKSEITEIKTITQPITQITRIGTKVVTIHNCDYWGRVVNDMVSDERERRWLKSIMYWESGCNSGSNIDNYLDGTKGFYGLFQFSHKTFYELFGGTNIWDGYNQIEIAHKMYNNYHTDEDLSRQWPTNKLFLKYYGDKYEPKK